MNGLLYDIYVLKASRSKEEIINFNKNFLIDYKEMADEYEVPQYSENPKILFKTTNELMTYCETEKNLKHTIYWKSLVNELFSVVFYCDDGNVIFGLSTEILSISYILLNQMKEYLNSNIGYITQEEPAPTDANKFRNIYSKYKDNNLNNLVSIVIGKEYDYKIIKTLKTIIKKMNGNIVNKLQGIAGSQEYDSFVVFFKEEDIFIEIETYIGITITGKKEIVGNIQNEIRLTTAST